MLKERFLIMLLAFGIGALYPAHIFAAAITGTIKYEGEAPKFKELKMDADPICAAHHNEPVYPQSLALGEGNTMGNILVQIKSGFPKKEYPAPTQEVILDQKGCIYDPHVLGLRIGQTLKILNPDGTLHNVHVLSKVNPEFNLAMPQFRKDTTKTFDKAETTPFSVKCDVHPWMTGYIAVFDHPYFQVTKADGQFTLADLPAGTYEVETWHEKLGTKTQSVTVTADETKTVDFSYAAPQKSQ